MIPPPPQPALEPLVLRSRRRSALWWALLFVPWWVLVFLLAALSEEGLRFSLLFLLLSVLPMPGLVLPAVSAQWGVTIVDGRGVTRRLGRSSVHVPWPEVVRIRIVPSWTGRRFVLHRISGRPIVLSGSWLGLFTDKAAETALIASIRARAGAYRPAVEARFAGANRAMAVMVTAMPLAALVAVGALTLYLTVPWAQPWWPGMVEAAHLPDDDCAVLDRDAAARLVPGGRPRSEGGAPLDQFRHCSWAAEAPSPELSVSLHLSKRRHGTDGDAVKRAHEFFVEKKDECPTGLRGLGAEACTGVRRLPDGSNEVVVTAREHNVLVTVGYRTDRPAEEVTGELAPLVRAALGRIHFA
jgi:hypothetical protein